MVLSRYCRRAEVERCRYRYVYGYGTIKYFLPGSIDNYTKLCTIEVDLSHLPLSPRPKYSGAGKIYRIDYDIVLLFGLTELQAMLAWKEDVGPLFPLYCILCFLLCFQGVEQRSPAKVLYDPDPSADGS